jgi:putative nucleotidyltransferase with HDIG domain
MKTPQRLNFMEFHTLLWSFFGDCCIQTRQGVFCLNCGSPIPAKSAIISLHDAAFEDCQGAGKTFELKIPYCPQCEEPPSATGCVHVQESWIHGLTESAVKMLNLTWTVPKRQPQSFKQVQGVVELERVSSAPKVIIPDEQQWLCKCCGRSGKIVTALGESLQEPLNRITSAHLETSPTCAATRAVDFSLRGRISTDRDWREITATPEPSESTLSRDKAEKSAPFGDWFPFLTLSFLLVFVVVLFPVFRNWRVLLLVPVLCLTLAFFVPPKLRLWVGRKFRVWQLRRKLQAIVPSVDAHSVRVSQYSKELAKALGLPRDQVEIARVGGLLHDLGKLEISPDLLGKEGRLTPDEEKLVRRHTVLGVEILQQFPSLVDIIPAVRSHHERYDGNGFPDGLRGESIPLVARIVAVAEAFDAMTSQQPFRRAFSLGEAREKLTSVAGRQFDPDVVKALLSILPKGHSMP